MNHILIFLIYCFNDGQHYKYGVITVITIIMLKMSNENISLPKVHAEIKNYYFNYKSHTIDEMKYIWIWLQPDLGEMREKIGYKGGGCL